MPPYVILLLDGVAPSESFNWDKTGQTVAILGLAIQNFPADK